MAFREEMKLEDWIQFLLRWKWVIVFSFLIIVFAASVYCVLAREMYRSETTILVIPQEIPEDYIKSTVTYSIEARLTTIQQQVLSRTRLLEIVDTFKLFPDLKGEITKEALVKKMRDRITIEVKGEKRRRDKSAFTISYQHEDPKTAMLVTSKLASMFIDRNLSIREQQAVGTAQFLETQLASVKKQLDRKDRRIKAFRTKYLGELPEQLQSNLGMLTRYQEELKANAEALRGAEDRKLLLDTQIAELMSGAGISGAGEEGKDGNAKQVGRQLSLNALIAQKKAELSYLRNKYTEDHPDIRKLREEIARLENTEKGEEGTAYLASQMGSVDRQIMELNGKRKAVDLEIKNLKAEKEGILKFLEMYSKRVERTPKRELEIKELMRDYNNLMKTYEELLAKKTNADMSSDLEKRQKGEQFQVIDPAYLPEKPDSPKRGKIMLVASLLSLSVGGFASVMLEYFDKSFKTPGEYKEAYSLPVLVALPDVATEEEMKKKARVRLAIAGGFLFYFAAVIIFIFVYFDRIRAIFST